MKIAARLAFAAFLLLVAAWPLIAFAQALPTDVDQAQVQDLLTALLHAPSGPVRAAFYVVVGLMLATLVLRHFGSKLPGVIGAALASPIASWVIPLVFSIAGAIGASLARGVPLSPDTILGALIVALGSGGVMARQLGAVKDPNATPPVAK